MTPEFMRKNFRGAQRVSGKTEWRFYPVGQKCPRYHFRLVFLVETRSFKGSAFNRSNKQDEKTGTRELPADTVAVLRGLLPAKALAECTAASIKAAGGQ